MNAPQGPIARSTIAARLRPDLQRRIGLNGQSARWLNAHKRPRPDQPRRGDHLGSDERRMRPERFEPPRTRQNEALLGLQSFPACFHALLQKSFRDCGAVFTRNLCQGP
jgi:hypothetical protein